MTTNRDLNIVPFISVDHMMKLVLKVGVETFLSELANAIEEDFLRWEQFDKTPRVASHSTDGVIELMPTSDGTLYGFKYVNGHPKNTRDGRQTVTAFGVLADVGSEAVLEFPTPDDQMVKRLLKNKREGTHDDYTATVLERALADHFDIVEQTTLPSGTRILYHLTPR